MRRVFRFVGSILAASMLLPAPGQETQSAVISAQAIVGGAAADSDTVTDAFVFPNSVPGVFQSELHLTVFHPRVIVERQSSPSTPEVLARYRGMLESIRLAPFSKSVLAKFGPPPLRVQLDFINVQAKPPVPGRP